MPEPTLSPKVVTPPVTKPTPAKPATVPQKKAVKAKPPPKAKTPNKSTPQPTVAKPQAKSVSTDTSATKKETPRKRKLMGLIVDDNAILATNDTGETPVRQSRRIAQIKIKEEAERRKEEEMALKQMKAASEKKKKVVDETYTAKSESSASEDDSEKKLELKKKIKKKGKGANPWQTDSDHESVVSEEEHYESDHKLVFFKSDHEFSPESDIEDESQIVQTKRARTAQKDDEDEIIDDGYACQKCNKHDHPEWILLCDKCDKGYHCSCLVPMLFIIPEGDWFCPPCQQDKLIETLESQLQNLDKGLKEKELEEIRRQRAAFTSISVANVVPDEPEEDETEYHKQKSTRKRPTTSRRRRRNVVDDMSNDSSFSSSGSSRSDKGGSSSSSSNSSDDEPIYKLRKRRQVNVSYRFNEYDDLINSAIKKEMDSAEGAGNLGRGKDISTIIEADKEEKRIKQKDEDDSDEKNVSCSANEAEMKSEEPDVEESKSKPAGDTKASASDSDSEPIRKTLKRPLNKKSRKKHRKLNSLDIESEDDGSDDDFRTSSFSEDEEDENFSAESDSDSSLDCYRRKKNKKHETRRSVRSRRKRYDEAFINDSDGDDDIDEPKVTRKKKKEDSDFSEFNDNESTDEEGEEDVDSEDLCDSTDSDESDRGWRSKKAKKSNQKKPRPPTDNSNTSKPMPKKKVKKVEDSAFRAGIPKSKGKCITDESDDEDVQAKSRRTRGKKLTYLNLLDEFESSDSDGIKPGVKRPDTPPEERAAFIKKQEEIKRMLAEKNTEAAAALAAPKLTGSTPEKSRRPAGPVDSLSTIPRSIIQNAKALDPDYKKGRDSDDTDGFDDDLPDDFDAEGMDEEEIAKMMEEEDFAQQQLKAVGERVRKMKEAELLLNKKKETTKVTESSVITPTVPPSTIPAHLATPPSIVVPPTSFSPRPSIPMSHLIRPPHSSPLSPGNIQHMQSHPVHPQHSPHGSQHLPLHPHLSPHGLPAHHIAALNQVHPPHQMVRGPPHHLLHPSQHPMQHFNPLQRHPMQLTQSPHISPNSQASLMAHRPQMHPSIRSPHHPLQMHPSQMQSHPPPSIMADYPGDSKMMKLTKSGVEPKKRGRKSKAELQAIEQAKGLSAPDPSTSMSGPSLLQHQTHPAGQEPIIPTTVLAVQNTRLMDPSELGPPGANLLDVKKRGRRKKFTPLRESLNKPGIEAPSGGHEQKTNPILAERLGIQGMFMTKCFRASSSFFFVHFQTTETTCRLLRLHNYFHQVQLGNHLLLLDYPVHHSALHTVLEVISD